MTDTTERAELLRLAGELADKLDQMPFGSPNTLLRRVESALRRLASQDQEPVAWLQSQNGVEIVSKHRLDPDASKFGWTERPLYLSPPPAAGWDEAIEAAMAIAKDMRDKYSSPTGDQYTQGLWDHSQRIIGKIKALRHNTAPTPPHGGADAVVAYSALCEPRESQASDNLEGALYDIIRLADEGKPADQVCIRTIERVLAQLVVAETALSHHPAPVAANASAEARLREALEAVEPYLDAIVCYASAINEHHGNEVAKLVRDALSAYPNASDCAMETEDDEWAARLTGDETTNWQVSDETLRRLASDCDKQETTKSEGGVEGHAGRPWPSPKTDATNDGAMASLSRPSPVAGIESGPSDRTADATDLKTDPKLLDLLDKAKNYVMTPDEIYEQKRSFVRGMCPSDRDFNDWCKEVDKLLPPRDAFTVGRR